MIQDWKKQLTGIVQRRKISESRCSTVPLLYWKNWSLFWN